MFVYSLVGRKIEGEVGGGGGGRIDAHQKNLFN